MASSDSTNTASSNSNDMTSSDSKNVLATHASKEKLLIAVLKTKLEEIELKELPNKTSDNLKTFKETQNKYPHDPNIVKVVAATDKELIFLNFVIDYIVSDN
ncbi:unnamed protein product [Adineta steineri]|uniref:Uncharacterized protein n=1 Tax=Adineta steineri TaxID=433720 RepID=A0A814TZE2_9BILA|nr:unnamed protein product [Adineta steineri]CAF1168024.1 unnamed protein product [Adineta steineri]